MLVNALFPTDVAVDDRGMTHHLYKFAIYMASVFVFFKIMMKNGKSLIDEPTRL